MYAGGLERGQGKGQVQGVAIGDGAKGIGAGFQTKGVKYKRPGVVARGYDGSGRIIEDVGAVAISPPLI